MELPDWLISYLPFYIAYFVGMSKSSQALRRQRRAAVLSLVGWSILAMGLLALNGIELQISSGVGYQYKKVIAISHLINMLAALAGWSCVLLGLSFAYLDSSDTRHGITYDGLDLHAASKDE